MRWMIAITLLALFCAAKAAEVPATTRQTATVDAETKAIELRVLVASLSAFDDATRQDAKQHLLKIGKPAVKLLEDVLQTSPDPVARRLAKDILDEVDTPTAIVARAGDRWKATEVSLDFDKAPAHRVYESLRRQASRPLSRVPMAAEFAWPRAEATPVTIHLDRVSFWQAVLELEKQTGLTATEGSWGNVRLASPPPAHAHAFDKNDPLPVHVHGPFLIVGDQGASTGYFETLTVFAEPKLRFACGSVEARVDEALDKEGRRVEAAIMPPPAGAGQLRDPLPPRPDPRPEVRSVFDVRVPQRPSVVYLKGVIRAELLSPDETTEVIRHFDGELHWAGGRGLTVDVKKSPAGNYPVEVQLADENFARRLSYVSVTLEDANGTAFEGGGTLILTPDNGHAKWRSSFRRPRDADPPAKITLQIPRKPMTVEIPFEFGQPPAK